MPGRDDDAKTDKKGWAAALQARLSSPCLYATPRINISDDVVHLVDN